MERSSQISATVLQPEAAIRAAGGHSDSVEGLDMQEQSELAGYIT